MRENPDIGQARLGGAACVERTRAKRPAGPDDPRGRNPIAFGRGVSTPALQLGRKMLCAVARSPFQRHQGDAENAAAEQQDAREKRAEKQSERGHDATILT